MVSPGDEECEQHPLGGKQGHPGRVRSEQIEGAIAEQFSAEAGSHGPLQGSFVILAVWPVELASGVQNSANLRGLEYQ